MTAVMLVAAIAGIRSMYLGDEQVKLAQDQMILQREANTSSDAALENILEAISSLKFRLDGVYQNQRAEGAQDPGGGPSAKKAHHKPGSADLRRESAPKSGKKKDAGKAPRAVTRTR